jgi:hypothetical protein
LWRTSTRRWQGGADGGGLHELDAPIVTIDDDTLAGALTQIDVRYLTVRKHDEQPSRYSV